MQLLRSKYGLRLVAAFLVASIVPLAVQPAVQAAEYTAVYFYSGWLRAQLDRPVDEAFERAIRTAALARPDTFNEFLTIFARAYEAQQPALPLTDVFASPDLSKEALLLALRGRFQSRMGGVDPPYASLIAGQIAASGITGTGSWFGGMIAPTTPFVPADHSFRHISGDEGRLIVFPFRTRSSAQPLGP